MFKIAFIVAFMIGLPRISAAAALVASPAAHKFALVGFPSVDRAHPEILVLETNSGIFRLKRQAVLMANKMYLKGFAPHTQVVLTVDGKMIQKFVVRKASKGTL